VRIPECDALRDAHHARLEIGEADDPGELLFRFEVVFGYGDFDTADLFAEFGVRDADDENASRS